MNHSLIQRQLVLEPMGIWELLLAFTVAPDPLAPIGNQRQLLHVARRTCAAGCAWMGMPLVDINYCHNCGTWLLPGNHKQLFSELE